MIEQIKASFPQVEANNCLWQTTKPKIFIFDQNDNKIIEVESEEAANFTIDNPNQKEIAILAIDKCVFDDQSKHKKCDFAAFDDKVFVFVEIKDTNRKKSSSRKKRHAKDQLETTIKAFLNKINFDAYELYAVISWRYKSVRPAFSTKMQEAAFHFRMNYNVKLAEGNRFDFNSV